MPTINDSPRPPWNPKRKAHAGRAKPNQHVYNDHSYRKAVRNHKMRNPNCVMCLEKGIVTPVQDTDHILPINMGGSVMNEDNWQSLCKRCHSIKSAGERSDRQGGGG